MIHFPLILREDSPKLSERKGLQCLEEHLADTLREENKVAHLYVKSDPVWESLQATTGP